MKNNLKKYKQRIIQALEENNGRNRKDTNPEIFVKALKSYIRSKDKKMNKLMEYARVFKIEKKTYELIEVL